ncbi:MAG: carboxylesterase family protein [Actinomycetota bacterium]
MAADRPIVRVEQGDLEGTWADKGRFAVFKGVPFAAPPVGERRWRPPAPAEAWSGVRPAAKHGAMAIQRAAAFEQFMGLLVDGQGWRRPRAAAVKTLTKVLPAPKQSEDCLYLTVRSPALDPDAKLPVMVWIHGGDHQDGSGSDVFYDANVLSGHDVVTVSINYRLGVLGYLAHPELEAESPDGVAGNYGTLDQIAALTWVRDNVDRFGGDPDNVTIFGESAGGESVLHLMTSPLARGLFHRAVPQSPANGGQMIHLRSPFLAHESANQRSQEFAAALGITGDGQLARLRALSADTLYELARADERLGGHYPVIDGHVLPESPLAAFAGGRQAPVPLLIGSNADEGTLIRPVLGAPMVDFRLEPLPADGVQPAMADAFGDDMARLVELYPGLDRRSPSAETDFMGDHMFGARAYYYARNHADAGHPTYLYLFARTPKSPRQTAGAYHAAEIPFVHGKPVPILPLTAEDKLLSAVMVRHWTDFAKTGDPNPADGGTGGGLAWPAFAGDDPRWMRFNHTTRVEAVDRREQYEIFNTRTDRLVTEMAALAVS